MSKDSEDTLTIGVLSDTHGWLDPELLEHFKDVDHILHAGDIGHPDVLEQLRAIAPLSVVRGNIDGGALRFEPLEVVVELAGRRFAIRHICGSPKRPNKATREFLMSKTPDVLIVGHSHIPVVAKVLDTFWVNPGAAGRQGFHDQRYAMFIHVDRKSGELSMDRIHLGSRANDLFGV